MRGFRLSRPSDGGGPRRSVREDAEAEAAAELRRVLEGAGLPPEETTEVLERTAARRAGGKGVAARGPAPPASTAPEPAPDEPREAGQPPPEAARGGPRAADQPAAGQPTPGPRAADQPAADSAAGPAAAPPTRRVRKSPPGAVRPPAGPGAAASPPPAAAGRASRSGRR